MSTTINLFRNATDEHGDVMYVVIDGNIDIVACLEKKATTELRECKEQLQRILAKSKSR